MIYFCCVVGYLAGILLFCTWDAYIGFGVEMDGNTWPPLGPAAVLWPAALFAILISFPTRSLSAVRERRLARKELQAKLRKENDLQVAQAMADLEQGMLRVDDLEKKYSNSVSKEDLHAAVHADVDEVGGGKDDSYFERTMNVIWNDDLYPKRK